MANPRKKSESLEDLQAKWYKKLEKSGFKDIETPSGYLKEYSFKKGKPLSIEHMQAKQEYYTYAARFLEEHKFQSRRERIIWEYHANGIAIRDIVELLKKARLKNVPERNAIWMLVKRLENEMKRRYRIGCHDDEF